MTKHRAPLSIEQALDRIAGQLPRGVDQMAELTTRSVSLVRKWRDPDRREKISIDDAITLDLAYQTAGGIGAPLHETYSAKLELAGATRFAENLTILRLLPEVIKESSEAEIALALAALPDATACVRREGAREVREAIAALNRMLPMLESGQPTVSQTDLNHQTGPPSDIGT